MLSLDNQAKIDNAVKTLEDCQPILKEYLSKLDFDLHMDGVNDFSSGRRVDSRVLFAKLKNNESYEILEKISDAIIQKFITNDVVDPKDFDHVHWDPKNKM